MAHIRHFDIFLQQFSMPCIFLADVRHIYLFLHTIKYALYISGTYVTDLHVSPKLSMPWNLRQISDIFKYLSVTIIYALNNPVRYATKLRIYPHYYVCPAYSWHKRHRFTYFSPQISMPSIYARFVYPTITYALYIHGRYVSDLLISQHN